MLNIGDNLFIANYGAGIVLDVQWKTFLGATKEYIIIYLLLDDMDFLIPMEKINNYNIRSITDKAEIEMYLAMLEENPNSIEGNWNKRYRKNKSKIASGKFNEMMEVYRELKCLKEREELPLGEEKILNKAKGLLTSEIMLLYGIPEVEALQKLKIDNL